MDKITVDYLIISELEGKSKAITAYDNFLWKIRTAFAILIYGFAGFAVTLVEKDKLEFIFKNRIGVCLLLIMFTLLCGVLDFSFLNKKVQVIRARNELMSLSLKYSLGYEISQEELNQLLLNSGEKRERIRLNLFSSYEPLIFIYLPPIIIIIFCLIYL